MHSPGFDTQHYKKKDILGRKEVGEEGREFLIIGAYSGSDKASFCSNIVILA